MAAQHARVDPFRPLPARQSLTRVLFAVALVTGIAALAIGFFVADGARDDVQRIAVVHVPAAWMSLFVYAVMTAGAVTACFDESPVIGMLASALAPTGAIFAFLAVWTGALWVRPRWGVWWVWDPRLAIELLLLVTCLAVMTLHAAIDDPRRADRAAGTLAIVGGIALPLAWLAMRWFGTQADATDLPIHGATAPTSPGVALGLMIVALVAWSGATGLARVRAMTLERARTASWVDRPPEARP